VREPDTRFGLPPYTDIGLPTIVPWDKPISELSGLWLVIECTTCGTTEYPVRRLAADQGWTRTLRGIVPRLRCDRCKAPPTVVVLVKNPADQGFKAGKPAPRLDLLAGPERLTG
jgi:hypothetical protein